MLKRKRSVVTFEKKLEIIAHMMKGKSGRALSELCSIPKSTIGDICKDREKIEGHDSASECPSLMKKRRIVREANFEKNDQACHLWFLQQRSKGAPISGPLLREKALLLSITCIHLLTVYHK